MPETRRELARVRFGPPRRGVKEDDVGKTAV